MDDNSQLQPIEEPEEISSMPLADGVAEAGHVDHGTASAVSFKTDGRYEDELSIEEMTEVTKRGRKKLIETMKMRRS